VITGSIFKTEKGKFKAVVEEITANYKIADGNWWAQPRRKK
jgi:hypothetical protein